MSKEKIKAKRIAVLQEYNEKVKSGEIERPKPKNLLEKWKDNKTSLRKAVSAQCFMCMGGTDGDNVMKEIRECSSYSCTLREVRPYK